MDKGFFHWKSMLTTLEKKRVLTDMLGDTCLFNMEERSIHFSKGMSEYIFNSSTEHPQIMGLDEFFLYLSKESRGLLETELQCIELVEEGCKKTPIFLYTDKENLGSLIYLYKPKNKHYILGSFRTNIIEYEERINDILHHDELTGLKNRYCYERDLGLRFLVPEAKGSIVYIDIHNFKMFNEIFDRQFGDLILKDFARLLEHHFTKHIGIYRISGDEFLVHLKEIDRDEILKEILTLLDYLKYPRVIKDHKLFLSINSGIAIYPQDGQTQEQILQNANIAMYMAARNNKDGITFFLDTESLKLERQYQMGNEIRNSIQNGFKGFQVLYQPIVNSDTGNWVGAEALLRYHSELYGNVPVDEVIELLEHTDLILDVGKWVAQNAICECRNWQKNGFAGSIVHINCSGLQVRDIGFIQCVEKTLKEQKLDPGCLICELTETVLIHNMDIGISFCNSLVDLGIRVALDDFGTGCSSLSYLRCFPIYEIKIDKSFAMQYSTDEYSKVIISTVNSLADKLGIVLCVEGVENKETFEQLQKLHVKHIQGFYFAKPLEADQFFRDMPCDLIKKPINSMHM